MELLQKRLRRAPSLAIQAHDAILDLMTSGRIEPGERLVLDRLAEQLGVSPTPVREAVARLVQEGLVTEVASGRLQVIALTEHYVRDTFLVRGALEGLAAELAAPRLSNDQLATLHALMDATTSALAQGNHEVYARSDASLHHLIATTADNRVLLNELQALQPHIDLIRGYSQRNNGDHIRESHQEHVLILEALSRHDAAAARQMVEQHIRNASARIVRLIDFRAQRAPTAGPENRSTTEP